MILKIGRNQKDNESSQAKDWTWEYTEKVGNVNVHSYDDPIQGKPVIMDVMYYLDNPKILDATGECHSTTLSGSDVCYLMTDEGKTIERIR